MSWRAWLGAIAAIGAAVVSPPAIAEITPFPVGSVDAERCAPPEGSLDDTLRFVVYRGPDVAPGEVQAQLKRAAAFYQPHALRLLQHAKTRSIDARALLEGNSTQLSQAIRRAGIDPARPAHGVEMDAARRITCEVATAPLRRFLEQSAADNAIRLVFLRSIATPDAAIGNLLRDMRGLTLAPAEHLDPALRVCLALGPDDPPVILLGLDAIAARRPGTVDITLIHEIGHVLGFGPHQSGEHIMNPEPPTCLPNPPAHSAE